MPDRNDLRGAHYTYRPIGGGVMVSQLELYGGEASSRREGGRVFGVASQKISQSLAWGTFNRVRG